LSERIYTGTPRRKNKSAKEIVLVIGFKLPIEADCRAFPAELIDDIQHTILAPIVGMVLDESLLQKWLLNDPGN
jgi:hypothetical protein